MNLIVRHADDYFIRISKEGTDSAKFVSQIKRNIVRYKKSTDKIIFIERIVMHIKSRYDRHEKFCTLKENHECRFADFYEEILFFLKDELNKLETTLLPSDFNMIEKSEIDATMSKIIDSVNVLEFGKVLDYNTFIFEMREMKEYYYLNKKIWHQLLTGKLSEMLGMRLISVELCKEISSAVNKIYPVLIETETE